MTDTNKSLVDCNELFRRDLHLGGPNPVKGILEDGMVRKFYTRRPGSYGTLYFRPDVGQHSTGAYVPRPDKPVTPQQWAEMWAKIQEAGFTTDGEDRRLDPPIPVTAILDLDNPLVDSDGLNDAQKKLRETQAAEWIAYLDNPGWWYSKNGATRTDYTCIWFGDDNTPDFLGDIHVLNFRTHAPPKDAYALETEASNIIADETSDHFTIKFVIPAKQADLLGLQLLGYAVGHDLDLRAPCANGCGNKSERSNGWCWECWTRRHMPDALPKFDYTLYGVVGDDKKEHACRAIDWQDAMRQARAVYGEKFHPTRIMKTTLVFGTPHDDPYHIPF